RVFIVGLEEWKNVFDKHLFDSPKALIEQKGLIPLNDFIIYSGLFEMNNHIKQDFGNIDNYYAEKKTDDIEFRNANINYLINEGKIIFNDKDIKKPIADSQIYNQI